MSTVNITRHDRGLDSKRIEKIIELIENRVNEIKWDRRDVLRTRKEELVQEVIEKYELKPHYVAIDEINEDIKKLEEQIEALRRKKEPHKIEIAKIMRGSESTYDYGRVREDSPADKYMKSYLPNVNEMKENLTILCEEMTEKLWLAKDIEEARALYEHALEQINAISQGL